MCICDCAAWVFIESSQSVKQHYGISNDDSSDDDGT